MTLLATEYDAMIVYLEDDPESEDEVAFDSLMSVISAPAGPLKAKARVYWHKRPRSGPFERDPEDAT